MNNKSESFAQSGNRHRRKINSTGVESRHDAVEQHFACILYFQLGIVALATKNTKFRCVGCPYAVCKMCASAEFTVVRGVQGLCIDCLETVKIIELNFDHDSEGVSVIT
jgi:hypothetical protein